MGFHTYPNLCPTSPGDVKDQVANPMKVGFLICAIIVTAWEDLVTITTFAPNSKNTDSIDISIRYLNGTGFA